MKIEIYQLKTFGINMMDLVTSNKNINIIYQINKYNKQET